MPLSLKKLLLKGIAAFFKCGSGLSYANMALGLPGPFKKIRGTTLPL